MHSGPVTAGVLRSERSRFQLFGDTVNTAARMEQTGRMNMIQVSQATADLLIAAGKDHWIEPREDPVDVKGKGILQTYWALPNLTSKMGAGPDETEVSTGSEGDHEYVQTEIVQRLMMDKTMRLVDWNVDIIKRTLKLIVAHRRATMPSKTIHYDASLAQESKIARNGSGYMPLNEVAEIVSLPCFDANIATKQPNESSVELPERAVQQLREFVMNIAAM
jgi:hypothetical protein